MYSASQQASAPVNGMPGEIIDGSGTINPAALNTAGTDYVYLSIQFLPLHFCLCRLCPALLQIVF